MKREYDAIRAQQRENSFSREHSMSRSKSSGTHSPRRHTIKYYNHNHHDDDEVTPRITPLNSVKKVTPQSTAFRPDSTLALNDIEQPQLQPGTTESNENTAVLQSGVQSNYGSIGTIMSTMSSMTVTVAMHC